MIFTVESRDSEIWTIAQGTISNRGPFIQSLYQNDCVIITGNEGINFVPLLAHFDADSKLLLKSVRATFPGAPALRPIPFNNNVTFFFMAMPKTLYSFFGIFIYLPHVFTLFSIITSLISLCFIS